MTEANDENTHNYYADVRFSESHVIVLAEYNIGQKKWISYISANHAQNLARMLLHYSVQRGVNLFELFAKHQPGVAGCGWLQGGRHFLST